MLHDLDLDSLDPKVREKVEEIIENVDLQSIKPALQKKLQELILLSDEELFDKFNKYCSYDSAFKKNCQSAIDLKGSALMKSDIALMVLTYEEKENFGIKPIN